jgi:hypothetical protein
MSNFGIIAPAMDVEDEALQMGDDDDQFGMSLLT